MSPYSRQRSSPRAFVVCPIAVEFQSSTAHGIVRDMSSEGIFFYLNSKPPLHTTVNFSVRLQGKRITGIGEVVRVEQAAPGAAIGVAIKISSSKQTAHNT